MITTKRNLIHPQTYCLLKGKQSPVYYSSIADKEKRAVEIFEQVAAYFKTTKEDLLKKDRHREKVMARNIVAYFIKIKTKLDDGRVGNILQRDRTTVINSINKIKGFYDINSSEEIIQHIETLRILI